MISSDSDQVETLTDRKGDRTYTPQSEEEYIEKEEEGWDDEEDNSLSENRSEEEELEVDDDSLGHVEYVPDMNGEHKNMPNTCQLLLFSMYM